MLATTTVVSVGRRIGAFCFMLMLAGVTKVSAQDVPWRVAKWNADSFGNQRVVVHVADTGSRGAVEVSVAWRRPDLTPEAKRVIVTDGSGRRMEHVQVAHASRDSGVVRFVTTSGIGDYYVYYLPYTGSVRSNYPRITYPSAGSRSDTSAAGLAEMAWWVRRLVLPSSGDATRFVVLPRASVIAFEAADSLSQRWPMQVLATPAEVDAAKRRAPAGAPFVVFVEDRANPIKMRNDIPLVWATRPAAVRTLGPALRDEYYAFQLGVWGLTTTDSLRVRFSALNAVGRPPIPATALDCINTDGVDWMGRSFHHDLKIEAGKITPIWCGVMIPKGALPGTYTGAAVLTAAGKADVNVPLSLAVSSDVAVNHGDDEPARLSRLRWLNSQLAADGAPTPPYTAVRVIPGGFAILGRTVQLDAVGFPRQITSAFAPDLAITAVQKPMLTAPFTLDVVGVNGKSGTWHGTGVRTVRAGSSRVQFAASGTQGSLDLVVHGTLDFDGNVEYQVGLVSRRDTAVRDVRMSVHVNPHTGTYFMGMNRPGGRFSDSANSTYHWKWDVAAHNQDAFWIGDINGGVQVTLKDEKYARPLNTNFYLQSPLKLPRSWGNEGKGSCDFTAEHTSTTAVCGSGPRTLIAHDTLWFNYRVLITPFHSIDTKTHFSTRYHHAYKPVDSVRATGANLVNVHHATAINPFINYPFLRSTEMKAYADSLHAAQMRFKIYYTVRELTNHAPEIWALRSLGTEVLAGGPGGGHSWLQENMVSDYLPGWYVPELRDVAMVTSGISRWHNFYVEGMQWLTQHAGVDGIYLDDVAFDRTAMQRIRRVLAAHGTPGERIDLHSANQYNKNDGFASSANLYLEHFPYIDRLWFGEYFNYDSPPDYWLVEMSGLPYGLMSEMLEKGGNPWRGMLFGMTNRLPWTGGDPRELWKAWDDFGLNTAKMRGWWLGSAAPVHTDHADVLATTYVRPGRSLIAVASWAKDTAAVTLRIDWKALGLDPAHVKLYAPAIDGFQAARTFSATEPIPVAPGKGWLIRVEAFDARPRAR